MPYRSRQYNHRNAQSADGKNKPFFSKTSGISDIQKKDDFFQAKSLGIQLNAAADKEKEDPKIQKMELPEKKKEEGPPPA